MLQQGEGFFHVLFSDRDVQIECSSVCHGCVCLILSLNDHECTDKQCFIYNEMNII